MSLVGKDSPECFHSACKIIAYNTFTQNVLLSQPNSTNHPQPTHSTPLPPSTPPPSLPPPLDFHHDPPQSTHFTSTLHSTSPTPLFEASQFTSVANFTSSGRGTADGCEITLAFVAAKPPAESTLGPVLFGWFGFGLMGWFGCFFWFGFGGNMRFMWYMF